MADPFNNTTSQAALVRDAYDAHIQKYWGTTGVLSLAEFHVPSPNDKGKTVDMFVRGALAAATTPLTEDVIPTGQSLPAATKVSVTALEYGNHTTINRYLQDSSFADFDAEAAQILGQQIVDTLEVLVATELVKSTNIIYSGASNAPVSATSNPTAATVVGDITWNIIRTAVTKLRSARVPTWSDGYYHLYVDPVPAQKLAEEAGDSGARAAALYADKGYDLTNGVIAVFEGVVVHIATTLPAFASTGAGTGGDAKAYQSFLLGYQALAKHELVSPHTIINEPQDPQKRLHTVAWYAAIGYKLFRSTACVKIVTI